MKRRPPPPPVVKVDEARDRIKKLSLCVRRRAIMVDDPLVQEVDERLQELASAAIPDLAAAEAQVDRLKWLRRP